MRLMLAALAAALSLAWLAPNDVLAQSRDVRAKKAHKMAQKQARSLPQGASVGHNGLCQRDTGTPTSQLNWRNPCDMEEFWTRMNQQDSSGDTN